LKEEEFDDGEVLVVMSGNEMDDNGKIEDSLSFAVSGGGALGGSEAKEKWKEREVEKGFPAGNFASASDCHHRQLLKIILGDYIPLG
jgi:hypothetical protein